MVEYLVCELAMYTSGVKLVGSHSEFESSRDTSDQDKKHRLGVLYRAFEAYHLKAISLLALLPRSAVKPDHGQGIRYICANVAEASAF